MHDAAAIDAPGIESRAALLRRLAAAFFLALLAVTWPLWTPEHAFPQVPTFAWLGRLPDGVQWILAAALGGSLAATAILPGRFRRAAPTIATLAALLAALVMAFDQHRWQAWAYHLTLCLWALALLPAAASLFWLRWLTIGIYAYSAWSKFDFTFLTTLGPEFVNTLARIAHVAPEWPSSDVKSVLAGMFPIGEMLIALALAWPKSRRLGLLAAILAHGILLLILGPWGLDHRWGVLVWNVYFIAQDPLLMLPAPGEPAGPPSEPYALPAPRQRTDARGAIQAAAKPAWGVRRSLGRGAIALALVAPLGEPWGLCDHWMAWSLYAPRWERTEIYTMYATPADWPAFLRPFLIKGWSVYRLRADLWSLRASRAPLPPQARFQLAVAARVAELAPDGWDQNVHVSRLGPADRWTGIRERLDDLQGRDEILAAAGKFWLNAQPRETSGRQP